MITISEKNQRARKPHICGFCNETIHPGEIYVSSFNKDDYIGVWTFKSHRKCEIIKNLLWDFCWSDCDYIDSQDFYDGVKKFCRYFICPQCAHWEDESYPCCDIDEGYCIDKVCEVLREFDVVYECGWKLKRRDTPIDELTNDFIAHSNEEEAIINYSRVVK